MRGYLLKVCGVFIISAVCEILLPDGNIKKYSKILMSLLVCITLLSPFEMNKITFNEIEIPKLSEDAFEESIYIEYKTRIEGMISEKCGVNCSVYLNEDKSIAKIVTEGVLNEEGKKFITKQLGVSEENIFQEKRGENIAEKE